MPEVRFRPCCMSFEELPSPLCIMEHPAVTCFFALASFSPSLLSDGALLTLPRAFCRHSSPISYPFRLSLYEPQKRSYGVDSCFGTDGRCLPSAVPGFFVPLPSSTSVKWTPYFHNSYVPSLFLEQLIFSSFLSNFTIFTILH